MNRIELEALPLEERRQLQREAGLETLTYVREKAAERFRPHHRRGRYGHKQKKEEKEMNTETQTHAPANNTNKSSAQRTVEEFTLAIERANSKLGQGEAWVASAKRASAYAAIWAPVALGVGWALIRMGRKTIGIPDPMA